MKKKIEKKKGEVGKINRERKKNEKANGSEEETGKKERKEK
jgi:hypothetical protein